MSRKGKVASIEILIVEGDLITPIANVVIEHAQNRSICRNKWAVEIQRQIIVGYGLQDVVVSDVVQRQGARCLAPEVHARKQGECLAETLSIEYLFGVRVPVLALPDQSLPKVRANVQCVMAIEARELKLATVRYAPNIVENYGSV